METARRCRFVNGATVRLEISDGEWIEVKEELSAGEARAVFSDVIIEAKAGHEWTLDPHKVGLTQILAYVVAWSLLDEQGRPAPVTETTVHLLDQDTFGEITEAVSRHDEAARVRRAARKNGQGGERPSPEISSSPAVVTGAWSGSAS